MNKRLVSLLNNLSKKGLDSFLVTNPANMYYLAAFKPKEASLLIGRHGNFIITDSRYREEAKEVKGFELRLTEKGYLNTIKKIIKETGAKKIGFESDAVSYSRASSIGVELRRRGVGFVPLSGTIEKQRLIKDDTEIALIKRAVAIAKRALRSLKIKPGRTEKELSVELDGLMLRYGADKSAFETIVASGPASSRPHADVTGKRINNNELLLIDFGASKDMYNCDLTRTLFLGKINPLLYNIYTICKEAQKRALRKIRPGAKAKDVDKAARDFISSKGFGGNFSHALGHGIGLSVHEAPLISAKSSAILRPNMIFTVEPGIYIEKAGGIRIEDMVLVTEKGCEVLTDDITK